MLTFDVPLTSLFYLDFLRPEALFFSFALLSIVMFDYLVLCRGFVIFP